MAKAMENRKYGHNDGINGTTLNDEVVCLYLINLSDKEMKCCNVEFNFLT
ncbi:hypothetical protein [Caedibacter taeniospiralis]|nr:hypothetical protein [Caedibacter taeniospiralis]